MPIYAVVLMFSLLLEGSSPDIGNLHHLFCFHIFCVDHHKEFFTYNREISLSLMLIWFVISCKISVILLKLE